MADRSVTVSLALNVRDYTTAAEDVVNANERVSESLGDTAVSGQEGMDAIADAAAIVGAALAALGAGAVYANMQFEKAMSAVSAATNATAEEQKKLSAAALQAGKDTVFSATEAAQAEVELAKAGVSTADILGGALKGSLDLAAAGQIELAEAATIAADVMTIWNLKGSQVGHIADVLSAAANKSSTDVHNMAEAINQAGLVADQVGFSLEETSGILAAFAQNGLKGSDAGTSLKTMLLRLIAPTQETTDKLQALGISVYDSSGRFVGAADLAGQLANQLRQLDEESRNAAMGTIFGSDAIRAANILFSEGQTGIQQWIEKVNDSGAASRTAAKLTDNLAGDLERLKGSLEVVAIQGGGGLAKALRAMAQQADAAVTSFGNLPVPVQSALTYFTAISGVSLLAVAGFLKLRSATQGLATSMAAVNPQLARVGTAMNTMVGFAGRFGAVALGFMAVGTAMSGFSKQATGSVPALAKSLEDYARSGKVAGEASIAFGKDLETLKYDLGTLDTDGLAKAGKAVASFAEAMLFGGAEAFDHSLVNARRRITDLDGALAALVQSGKADLAKAAFERLTQVAKEQGVSVDALTKGLPQYRGALAGATAEQTAATQAAEKQKAATEKVAQGFLAAVVAAKSFEDAIKDAKGAIVDLAQAEIGAEAAIDSFTDSIRENGHTFDINTEAGRNNKSAFLEVRNAAVAAAQAKYEETRATHSETEAAAAAAGVYNGYIDRLRQAAYSAGLNKSQVDALIGTYAALPPLKQTTITNNADQASSQVQNYNNNLRSTPRTVTTYIEQVYRTPSGTKYQRWGGVTEHAATGLLKEASLFGPGTRYAFAEPATGGEAFIPRFGDLRRSRGLLEHVAREWLGGQVTWGRGGQQGQTINITVNALPGQSEHEISRQVLRDIAWRGPN